MAFPPRDVEIVRGLAERLAEVAALPIQETNRRMWRDLNSLRPVRPMVWINELPWNELEPDIPLECSDEFCRRHEAGLRRTLYLWEHMRCDMVVDGVVYSPYVFHNSGFGIEEQAVAPAEFKGAKDYVPVIRTEADIEKIQTPTITPDWEATERNYQMTCELLDGALPVRKRGSVHLWCAPWDILVRWWGITELYTDMYVRPQFVHRGISRMMDALLGMLDQYESLGLLSVSNGNHRVGSGGLGITDELPQPDYDGSHARAIDQWGTSTGQIFSEVSPAMHDEFCLQYEKRWLERFGLNCYGCCEPLHNKIHLLRTIPRLRRISMSRWVDVAKGAEEIGTDYIFSYKPNPAVLAAEHWQPEVARAELRDVLEKTRGCVVELIMKDVSTCRGEPRRIWEWCELAVEVAEEFA